MRPLWAMLAAVAALAVGCGSDDDEATTATGGPASAMAMLAGTYERIVTSADIDRTDPVRRPAPNQSRPEPGPVELVLQAGTLRMTDRRADLTIRQDVSATSDGVLRIGAYQQPEEGSFCGPDVSQSASYRWSLSGEVLTLRAEDDECADRDSVLSGRWERR